MSAHMTKFQPDGWHTVTPRIVVEDPENLITFIKQVFYGLGEFRPGLPAEVRIGDSVVMVSDGGGLREPAPAFLYVYVEDTDSTYRRAIAANITPHRTPTHPARTSGGSRSRRSLLAGFAPGVFSNLVSGPLRLSESDSRSDS